MGVSSTAGTDWQEDCCVRVDAARSPTSPPLLSSVSLYCKRSLLAP